MPPRNKKTSPMLKAFADAIIKEYQPESAADVQNALKELFAPVFESILQGEMNHHLGYENNDHGPKIPQNRRNGYSRKSLKTAMGEIEVAVPRDREATFEPAIVPKHTKDVSGIEDKVLSMYARGLSQRDIAATIEDIYGFEISHGAISTITDSVLEQVNEWQNRPLKKLYTFVFVDCMYVSIRKEYETSWQWMIKFRPAY